jgi:ubiquinone/menaquinone biosynthesis C-methylase UbiE
MDPVDTLKDSVRAHWEAETCGTRGVDVGARREFFDQIERERYEWEPYIKPFARFERGRGKRVLEVGVGAGTDFINWVRAGADATGVDLTARGVELTRERVALEGFSATVVQADAERLPFPDESFDIVYSYGVLHHSPHTVRAISEVYRVLKPGGTALIMVYHLESWTTLMLWALHCLAKGQPWKSPRWAVYQYLESPGTKVYTVDEARTLFGDFARSRVWTQLAFGDLLKFRLSDKYKHPLHRALFTLYPRWLVRTLGDRFGLCLFVEATK